jgi:hypothetical protein
MATLCNITGVLHDTEGNALANKTINVRRDSGVVGSTQTIVPEQAELTTDGSGNADWNLYPGQYTCTVVTDVRTERFNIGVPDAATANLHELVDQIVPLTSNIQEEAVAAKDRAIAAAAATDADTILTAADVVLTGINVDIVATIELAARASAALALAAANAAGPAVVYATKALANTALAGLDADTVVEVSIDESQFGRRSRYRKTGGVYVFELDLTGRRQIFLDSINGNDANIGTSADLALLTPAAAVTLLSDGDELFVARNGLYYAAYFSGKKHLKVRPFGSGRRPIFTAAKEMGTGGWTLYSGSIYKKTVVHEFATTGSTDPAFYCQFAVFDDKGTSFSPARICGLDRITQHTGAARALATDIASMTAGTFTVRRTGADDASVFTPSATSFDYYVRLKDGTNPASNGRTLRYTEQTLTASFGFGCDIEGVDFNRSASKDHVGGGAGSGSVGRVHDVRCIDAAVHGSLFRSSTYTKYYAERNPFTSIGGAGNGLHAFRQEGPDGISRGLWADEIEVVGFETGVHAHGTAGPNDAFDVWEMGTIVIKDCGLGFFPNEYSGTVHVKKLVVEGGYSIYGNKVVLHEGNRAIAAQTDAGTLCIVDDFSFFSEVQTTQNILAIAGNVQINNGKIYLQSADTGGLSAAVCAGDGTITLNNFTVLRGPLCTTTFSAPTNIIANNSILGEVNVVPASLVAANCQLSFGFRYLSEIQTALPGVGSDCVVPFYAQPYNHIFTGGEIATDAAGTADITSGAAFFLGTQSTLEERGNLLIAGADGAGGPLSVQRPIRNAPNDSGGKFAYTCANIPSFPATVTAAAVTATYATRVIFPADPGTARLNRDANNLRVSDPTQYTVGQLIWLGAIGRREPFGLFEVSAVSGSVVTLTEDVPWRVFTAAGGTSYDLSSASTSTLNPSVSVRFGFAMVHTGTAAVTSNGTITYATGGTLDFTAARSSQAGRLNPPAAQRSTAFGGNFINAELGTWDALLAVNTGDSVSIAARIYVSEHEPQWVAEPLLARIGLLAPDHICARRGMGMRP